MEAKSKSWLRWRSLRFHGGLALQLAGGCDTSLRLIIKTGDVGIMIHKLGVSQYVMTELLLDRVAAAGPRSCGRRPDEGAGEEWLRCLLRRGVMCLLRH